MLAAPPASVPASPPPLPTLPPLPVLPPLPFAYASLRCSNRAYCRTLGVAWDDGNDRERRGGGPPHHSQHWPASIPRAIHLSCGGPSDCAALRSPARVLEWWAALNPGFAVHLHNDTACLDFIVAHYGEAMAQRYRSLPHWAHRVRSDLWRVLYLLKHGGVYADSDIEPLASLPSMLREGDRFLTSASLNDGFTNPHFIVARPAEPLLHQTLHLMTHRLDRTVVRAPHRYHNVSASKMEAYNSWTVCRCLDAVLKSSGFKWRNRGGVLAAGLRLLGEMRILAPRCRGCTLFTDTGSRFATKDKSLLVRRATVEHMGLNRTRIVMYNKYPSGPSGRWHYADSQWLRALVCPNTCLEPNASTKEVLYSRAVL